MDMFISQSGQGSQLKQLLKPWIIVMMNSITKIDHFTFEVNGQVI